MTKNKRIIYSYLHAHTVQTKKGKNGKKVKKANSPAHPLARAKKRIYSSNNKKIEINKIYYFEVSVLKIFLNEKN